MTESATASRTIELKYDAITGISEEVFRCRNGHIHNQERDGDYVIFNYAHCQCRHHTIWYTKIKNHPDMDSAMCADCGEVFEIEEKTIAIWGEKK